MPSKNTQQLTLLSEAPHARDSQSQDKEKDWMMTVLDWHSGSLKLLHTHGPAGWYGRTSPASLVQEGDGTLVPLSGSWGNAGMGGPIAPLTLSISEYHSEGDASLLSDILETGDLPQRYYLSATACRGILRRAKKRGKVLPPNLEKALKAQATTG